MSDDEYWPTYTREHPLYYIFNAETSGTGLGPRATSCAFWNDFMPKLYHNPGKVMSIYLVRYIQKDFVRKRESLFGFFFFFFRVIFKSFLQ